MENVSRVDVHCLNPRFAPLRLRDPERLARLTGSLRQHGQLMPVVVVAESLDPPRWVLIDGYRRLEALREIGEDRVWVDAWDGPVDEALLLCLARGTERTCLPAASTWSLKSMGLAHQSKVRVVP